MVFYLIIYDLRKQIQKLCVLTYYKSPSSTVMLLLPLQNHKESGGYASRGKLSTGL